MSEAKGGVGTRTLVINGHELEIYYSAYTYPTETGAKNSWERAEKRKKKGDHFSVFRQLDPQTNEWFVIAVSEKRSQLPGVRRAIAPGGRPIEPTDDHLRQVMLRRLRVVTSGPGPIQQTGRYGGATEGAVIDDAGFLHPYKRPQG
jgi:hypothetical protein